MANTSHASSITDRFVAQPCEFPTVKITLLQVREMKNCHPSGFAGAYGDGNLEFAENQSWHSDQGKAL